MFMLKKYLFIIFLLSVLKGQEKLPDISVRLLSGKTTNLYELLERGPVIIDFWATWCSPCKKLMKHLDKFHKHFNDTVFYNHTLETSKDNFKKQVIISRLDLSISYLKMIREDLINY